MAGIAQNGQIHLIFIVVPLLIIENIKERWNIYRHRHMFHPSQYSSVWLGLTSREQLMSAECSKHQLLSFAKMLIKL